MVKNEIQEQRMRGYFIEAAKEILKGEGLKTLSVRNIASRAGYSYATMYNYFRDVRVLVFECIRDFRQEGLDYIQSRTENTERGSKKIVAISRSYCQFFTEYPGIFELFFLERMSETGQSQESAALVFDFYHTATFPEWSYLVEQGKISEAEAEKKITQLNYTLTGLLVYYLNRNIPADWNSFQKVLEENIETALLM